MYVKYYSLEEGDSLKMGYIQQLMYFHIEIFSLTWVSAVKSLLLKEK